MFSPTIEAMNEFDNQHKIKDFEEEIKKASHENGAQQQQRKQQRIKDRLWGSGISKSSKSYLSSISNNTGVLIVRVTCNHIGRRQ